MIEIIENLMNPKCKEPPFFGGKSIGQIESKFTWLARRDKRTKIGLEQSLKRPRLWLKTVELDKTRELNFKVASLRRFNEEAQAELDEIKANYPDFVSREIANTPDDLLKQLDELKAEISRLESAQRNLNSFYKTLNNKNNELDQTCTESDQELHRHTNGVFLNGSSRSLY